MVIYGVTVPFFLLGNKLYAQDLRMDYFLLTPFSGGVEQKKTYKNDRYVWFSYA